MHRLEELSVDGVSLNVGKFMIWPSISHSMLDWIRETLNCVSLCTIKKPENLKELRASSDRLMGCSTRLGPSRYES